jgi:uncharacterized protein YecT (DUF1311 family)
MKYIIFSILFFLSIDACNGQTQLEMNEMAMNEYYKADKALNAVFLKIIKEYRKDLIFVNNLRDAQKIWIKFRDAEMKMKYPERKAGYYGSIHPVCLYNYLTILTDERTKKLKTWLAGVNEGDSCSGSIKVNY